MTQLVHPSGRAARDSRPPYDVHSRFVSAAKRFLPMVAVGLLALVVLWPRLDMGLRHLRGVPRVDPRLAHDLRMLRAHYSGLDRNNRPYVITAHAAQQLSDDDPIALQGPKADLTSAHGGWVEVSSNTGTFQRRTQILHLFGDVSIYVDRGDEFHTATARVDLAHNGAESTDPVTGQGPFGHITSQGIRILDRGATIIFTGHANLDLLPRAKKAAK
jgi:lipopolysaccharide export system protein LptC